VLTTADSVKVFEAIIDKTRNAPLPVPANVAAIPAMSLDQAKALQAEKGEDGQLKIYSDPHHRAKVTKAFQDAVGTGDFNQIMS